MTVPEETTKQSSPSRDCLDLYEEIITEEGTAKEVSFNNLNAEYEKCQKQIKQLISKLKEMQCLNTNLQNENQCLKKNISALIKTARVEITRKEEEINKLNQRLCVPGSARSFKSDPVPLPTVNTKLKDKELSKDIVNKPSSIRKEVKPQETFSKDLTSKNSSTKSHSEQTKSGVENKSESNSKTEQKCCKENEGTEKQTLRHKVVIEKKTKKVEDSDSKSKDLDRCQRSEGSRSSLGTVTNDSICEVKERLRGQPTKTGKSERTQESRNSKKSDVDYKTDSRKHSSGSHDKPSCSKENAQGLELHPLKEKHLKTHEKSEHSKESKGHKREKTAEHRHTTSEKDDGSQKLKRTHSSSLKNEFSQSSPPKHSASNRGIDSERKNKRYSEYSESRNVNKDSKSSKTEGRPSATKNKYTSNSKVLSDRDSRTEKKRSKDEENGTRSDQNHRGHRKEERVPQSSNKEKLPDCPSKAEESQNVAKCLTSQGGDNSVKNLKLSFMETLNLTLSPAKKKSQDVDPANSPVSAKETDINSVNTEASSKVCKSTKDGTDSQQPLSDPHPTDLKHSTKMSEEDRAPLDDLKLGTHSKLVEAACKEQSTVPVKEKTTLAEPIQSNVDCPQVMHIEPETNISDDIDTQSDLNDSDLIVIDTYVETDNWSCNEIPSENLNMSVPADNVQDDEVVLVQVSEEVDQTSSMKPNVTETTKGICESSNTDQCLHDESSVMSLDLNFLRSIPKVVSPLKSPARPLAHLPTTECTAKASVVSVSYKDLPSDVNIGTPNELNKENCEPVRKIDLGSDVFPIEISSDEIEEGEIVSDEEPDKEQSFISSPSQTVPTKDTNVIKSPIDQESKIVSLSKPNGVISPLKSTSETKKKTKQNTKAKLLASPIDKRKNASADSCLEGVLNIVPPSNIQDVLQMLRIIRKHIRKKYMKFKVQFSLTQFHRFVEATSLCFTTLANRLDWSRLCSSPNKLKNKLCKLIESKLKQLKKNGIVDRIFEQKLIDMKKKLWKFVEEQLDSLFDSLKGMIVNVCDKAKLEYDQDENKMSTLSLTKVQKSDQIKNSQSVSKTCKRKDSLAKAEKERCLRRLDFEYQRDASNIKPQFAEDSSVDKKLLKDVGTSCDKNVSLCHNKSPKSKMSPSTSKPDASNECLKDQHGAAGLSFNLVSDDHMGDIFKSLLNDSENLELNTLHHENIWILDTPKKKSTSSQKSDTVNSLTEIKLPVNATFPWPSISPPHINTLPRLESVLTPDVFDESCLLEVPTSTSSNKSIAASEDRVKFYSVLMEDLAVSLTVPSPLKSDSHLSFLRPICDPELISQVNANYSEDTVLDEEDATEQDIHLTLDSDNSSSGSLENLTEPEGFQCHPSEPMQAVIMEKSNDHFIVKIRRAVPSSSPVSDNSSVGESVNTATGQQESTQCNILDESLQQAIHFESKLKADTNNSILSGSMVPCSELSLRIDEKSENVTNVKHICSSPKTVHAVTPILPDALHQSLTDLSEVELTNLTPTEKVQLACKKSQMVCSEKNLKDDDEIKMTLAEKQLMDCDKMEATFTKEIINCQTPCAEKMKGNIPEVESVDLNPKKKKRRSLEKEPSSKRRNISFLPDIKDKKKGFKCGKTEDKNQPPGKHRRAVSEGNVNFTSTKHSPSSGISAKNVIKKKGEVVVSWTRNEDREILLECQQNGPNRKTFLGLASKMSKYPDQVEERFRQLMKLFKKSRIS
ncbi:CASP8-associated protein 2 [Mantella aurantiaca]